MKDHDQDYYFDQLDRNALACDRHLEDLFREHSKVRGQALPGGWVRLARLGDALGTGGYPGNDRARPAPSRIAA